MQIQLCFFDSAERLQDSHRPTESWYWPASEASRCFDFDFVCLKMLWQIYLIIFFKKAELQKFKKNRSKNCG